MLWALWDALSHHCDKDHLIHGEPRVVHRVPCATSGVLNPPHNHALKQHALKTMHPTCAEHHVLTPHAPDTKPHVSHTPGR